MGKKVIEVSLSEQSITRAIEELEAYKKGVMQKTDLFRERVAERLRSESQSGFNGAIVDDLLRGGKKYAEVTVTIENSNNITLVIANGEDAVWVEFGAGVFHNGLAGSSPHPKGSEFGFTIGSFGKGQGKKMTWGFYEDGKLRVTRGTPSIMPMYRAMRTVCSEIEEIAREVFA